jgi:thioesterase domain-containing protein/acyl carrier protein
LGATTDAASGVIGLIKVALMIKNATIPPQINFNVLNPLHSCNFKPFKILKKKSILGQDDLKKFFGVSSLGVGGTNAHMLLTSFKLDCKSDQKIFSDTPYEKKKFWLNENINLSSSLIPAHYDLNANQSKIRELISAISAIWKDVLGHVHVDNDLNFFEIGGDSLAAIEVCARINSKFGIDLLHTDLFQFSSINKQIDYILNRRTALSKEHIIKLNKQTKGKPLILIHPVGGGVFCYSLFAKLLEKFMPVYGIQNSILSNDVKSFDNLRELSKFYISKAEMLLGHTDFNIGGWSLGGNIAYEMACQLERVSKSLPHVFFFDSWNFSSLDFLHDESMHQAVQNYAPEVIDLPAGYDLRDKKHFFEMISQRMQLALDHSYSKSELKVCLFKSQIILPQFISINVFDNHWSKVFSSNQLSIININCSHNDLFNALNVNELVTIFLNKIGFL